MVVESIGIYGFLLRARLVARNDRRLTGDRPRMHALSGSKAGLMLR